jgi:hypothetical protein
MKNYIFFGVLWICGLVSSYGQGVFAGVNGTAPTRLGSLDGPLAGTNIVGQMLAGPSPSSLQPVGPSAYHRTNGFWSVPSNRITVPDVPLYEFAYVQLLAWDSTYWGSSLAGVPSDQLGRTDIVTVFLTTGMFPDIVHAPVFTQPAIVPPIPEPSVWALGVLALGALGMRRLVTRASK